MCEYYNECALDGVDGVWEGSLSQRAFESSVRKNICAITGGNHEHVTVRCVRRPPRKLFSRYPDIFIMSVRIFMSQAHEALN